MAERRKGVAVATVTDAQGNVLRQSTYSSAPSDPHLQAVLGDLSEAAGGAPTLATQVEQAAGAPGPLGVPMGAWWLAGVGAAWWVLS